MGKCATCPRLIPGSAPEGSFVWGYTGEADGFDVVARGTPARGPYGPFGPWTACFLFVRWRKRTRNVTRVDRIQPWTRCYYWPLVLGYVGSKTLQADCPQRNRTERWTESDREFELCVPFYTAVIFELLGLPGYQILKLPQEEVGQVEQGAPLKLAGLTDLDDRIDSVQYFMDGEQVEPGSSWDDLSAGCHTIQVAVLAKDGSTKAVDIPIQVAPPFTASAPIDAPVTLGLGEIGMPVTLTNNVEREVACEWSLDLPPEAGDVVLRETSGEQASNPVILAEGETRTLNVAFRLGPRTATEQQIRAVNAAAKLRIVSGKQVFETAVQAPSQKFAEELAVRSTIVKAVVEQRDQPAPTPPTFTVPTPPTFTIPTIGDRFTVRPPLIDRTRLTTTTLAPFTTGGGGDPLDASLANVMREILIRGLSATPGAQAPSSAPEVTEIAPAPADRQPESSNDADDSPDPGDPIPVD